MNERTTSKVFVGGDKTIGHVTNEIAGWLDNCMDSNEEILISDENTLPLQAYPNEKNIALTCDCNYGIFTFDRSDLPMRMAIYHLHEQGKATFVYRPDLDKMKITRAKKPLNNI